MKGHTTSLLVVTRCFGHECLNRNTTLLIRIRPCNRCLCSCNCDWKKYNRQQPLTICKYHAICYSNDVTQLVLPHRSRQWWFKWRNIISAFVDAICWCARRCHVVAINTELEPTVMSYYEFTCVLPGLVVISIGSVQNSEHFSSCLCIYIQELLNPFLLREYWKTAKKATFDNTVM